METIFNHPLITEFLTSHFAGRAFAFLHGSRAKGTARPDSDVDLIVVFETNSVSPRREIVRYGNYVCDVSVLSLATMKGYLDNAHASYNYRPAFMLENAVALPSGNVTAEALIQQAQTLIREIRRPPTPDSFRLFFTSLLRDLRHASSRSERTFLMVEAYRSITGYSLRWYGQSNGRKHAFEKIQRFDPVLFAELDNAFTSAMRLDESAQFIVFAEQFLETIGGPLADEYRD